MVEAKIVTIVLYPERSTLFTGYPLQKVFYNVSLVVPYLLVLEKGIS